MKTITLNFRGYWIEATKGSIPKKSGVYCVYAGTYKGKRWKKQQEHPVVRLRPLG